MKINHSYFLVIFFSIITLCSSCSSASKLSKSYKARDEKSISKLCKEIGVSSGEEQFIYTWNWNFFSEEVYLKNLEENKLSLIEKNLLDRYKDVIIVSSTPQWYYVIDNDNAVGIYNLDGTLFCPPLPGKVRIFKGGFHFMVIGDSVEDSELQQQILEFTQSGSGSPAGSCLAVVNWKKGEYIIPYGKYIDIAFARKLTHPHYYVANFDNNGEIKWGILDKAGKEIIPCKYASVGVNGGSYLLGRNPVKIGGKFIGSNEISMYEMTRNSRERYAIARQKSQALADILIPMAQTLSSISNALPESTSNSTLHQNSSQNYSEGQEPTKRSMSEVTSFNTDRNTYNKCETLLNNMKSGTGYAYSDQVREDTQRQMRYIREKWAKRGYTINQSNLETWGGK